jgi:hypothetical protein
MHFNRVKIKSGLLHLSPTKPDGILGIAILFMTASGLGIIFLFRTFGAKSSTLLPALILVLFFLAGALILYLTLKPIIFDLRNDVFWFGYGGKESNTGQKISEIENICSEKTYSPEERTSNDSRLALTMKNKRKINLMNYDNSEQMIADASKISNYLSIPYININA